MPPSRRWRTWPPVAIRPKPSTTTPGHCGPSVAGWCVRAAGCTVDGDAHGGMADVSWYAATDSLRSFMRREYLRVEQSRRKPRADFRDGPTQPLDESADAGNELILLSD